MYIIWKNYRFKLEREVFIKFSKFYKLCMMEVIIEMRL